LIVASKTPNELKAVMAHEIGHISGGDLPRARAAMRAAMGPALISIGLGVLAIMAGAPDAGVAIMSGSGQFAQASFVRHSRAEESAADQAGVKYLEATGQSPLGLVTFFEREFRDTEWLVRRAPLYVQTHPLPTDRLASLRAKVDKSPLRDKLDSPEDIARFEQMKAKLVGFLDDPRQISRVYPDTDQSIPARYARTVAAHRLKDMGSALKGVQGLIAEQPNNPHFQELAAQILYERGRAKEALPYARKALELKPGTMLLEYNLARALYQADKTAHTEEAIALLLSAQTREPDSPFVWAFLAEVYDSAGRGGEARLAWAEAQYWSNNFPRAKNFAERAKRELQPDTPAWRRADEISDMSETEIRAQGGRRRG
jgi:predicted Zn-dependent protease